MSESNRRPPAWGQDAGLQGQTYAIPTMFDTAAEIKPYVDELTLLC
ncbi:MAG: hypothetical protein LBF69_04190 [Prevotellaceae bacterium]|nr:hypothetical protein [Prevotellaceae bacterium]